MRLIETLAARRVYYSRSLPTLPDILLIDIPLRYAGDALALGRFYPVILETLAEVTEFEAFLCEDRTELVAPSLLDRRRSSLQSDEILFARYSPPGEGWPWLLLCRWPTHYTRLVPPGGSEFAREAYTIDVFERPDDLELAERKLLTTLSPCKVRHIGVSYPGWGNA